MHKTKSPDKVIVALTLSLLVFVLAFSMVNQVYSKKPVTINKDLNENVVNIDFEVTWDKRGTQPVSSFDWGSLEPGTSKTITVYIKNNQKTQITLNYALTNWDNIENSNFLTLEWDYDGHPLRFKETIQVTFTLTVDENAIEQNFNFDTTIIAQ